MTHYMLEVDNVIRKYRKKYNIWNRKLAPELARLSSEAKTFIREFMQKWDEAVIAGAINDYSITAKKLQEIISSYSSVDAFCRTVLWKDMTHYIFIEQREKDNEKRKGDAQSRILDDVEILRFCNDHLNHKII